MTATSSARSRLPSPHTLALAALVLLFLWVYGRFAFSLYFAMDDFINSTREMTGPLLQNLRDTFSGALVWSGYRPLTVSMRVLMTHAFGLDTMWAYYVIYLGMHLVNTLLTYRIVRRVSRNVAWAFFAAMVLLLLPSHNEAVFWFAANANVLALLFALLTLDFALTSVSTPGIGRQLATVAAYTGAVLSYETTIVLPFLIFLAEWAIAGRPRGKRLWFYALLGLTLIALLLQRFLAQGSVMVPARADYAVSLDPRTLLRGYLLIAAQMVLLYTSPFPGQPLFQYERNWLAPLGWVAIVTIASTLILTFAVYFLALRRQGGADSDSSTSPAEVHMQCFTYLFWIAWGLVWIGTIGVAFAALTGRNPENRYTYLLAFGMAIALTALLAWLYDRLRNVRALRYALLGISAGLLAFYAYTSASDATDWATAGRITRSAQTAVTNAIPSLNEDETIALNGLPGHVGTGLMYALPEAFSAAINLHFGTNHDAISSNQSLREWLRCNPSAAANTYLFHHDPGTHKVNPVVAAILCTTPDDCMAYQMARPDGTSLNHGLRYLELYDPANPELGAIEFLATFKPLNGKSCSFYQDYGVPLAADALARYPYAQRCRDAVSVLEKYAQ